MDVRSYDGDVFGMRLTNELPEYYWNVKSQEQRIYLICLKIEELYKRLDEEDTKIEELYVEIANLKKLVEEEQAKLEKEIEDAKKELGDAYKNLEDEFELFKEHGFDLYYKKQVLIWIDQNMKKIWENITARVFFGLEDGYFVAYVPDSWADLTFSTGTVYGEVDYGCLCLSYE